MLISPSSPLDCPLFSLFTPHHLLSQTRPMTSSTPSGPFKSLFRSSTIPLDNKDVKSARDSRTAPKIKLTKPANAPYSMLIPPTALFSSPPSYSSSASIPTTKGSRLGVKSPRLHGLFNKSNKKSPGRNSSTKVTNDSTAGWSSALWAVWSSRATGSEASIPHKLDTRSSSNSSSSSTESTSTSGTAFKGFHTRIWTLSKASKSDTEVAMYGTPSTTRQRYFGTKQKKIQRLAATIPPGDPQLLDPSSKEIMLHPSCNLSDQSIMSTSACYSSLPLKDQQQHSQIITCQQHHHYSSSRQSHEPCCVHQQQLHQSFQQQQQQRPSRMGITLAVHDIFGFGKIIEMILALFLAHDAFLCRRPFWMQCAIMAWEALIALMIVWAVLRVVGLAEVVVWGADDLVRGTLSTIQALGHVIRILFRV